MQDVHRPTRTAAALLAGAVGLALAAAPAPGEAARTLFPVCEDPAAADYLDRQDVAEVHLPAVDCLTERGVVEGLGNDLGELYLPREEVTRGQMSRFLARLVDEAGAELPAPGGQGFDDVQDDDVNADQIRALAAAGIVEGTGDGRYEPGRSVTRGQMAGFLVRTLAFTGGLDVEDLQGGTTPFTDVAEDAVFRPSIDGAYQLGLTDGVTEEVYAPTALVRRDEMASFVARTLAGAVTRTTVADRDGGALAYSVVTFLSESGRCMQVTAGEAWVTRCDAASGETPLHVYELEVSGPTFTVLAGVVTDEVATVEVETTDGAVLEAATVATRSEGLRAFSSPRLADGVMAVVVRDDAGEELDRYEQ